RAHLPYQAGFALQEPPRAVAELSIPFGPATVGGKRSHLVEAPSIPCFGDQLAFAQHGIISQRLQQRRISQRNSILVRIKDGCEVKTKSIDVILRTPVP